MARKKTDRAVEGFAKRLQIARERISPAPSRKAIMDACGVSSNGLYKWEMSAEPAINPRHLYKLADFLGVRPRWLAVGEGTMDKELPAAATLLAEDWATLPVEYQGAVRKHLDDLLSVMTLMPGLRNPSPDSRVGAFLQPAPGTPTNGDKKFTSEQHFHPEGPPDPSSKHGLKSGKKHQ